MIDDYVPASDARMEPDKDGKPLVNLNGLKIPVAIPNFIEQNQELSKLYVNEKNQERRGEIAHRIYELDLPLFKEWDLIPRDSREDYRQDAFLWIVMALETYEPEKGSFIYWLRKHIARAREQIKSQGRSWYCATCKHPLPSYSMARYHQAKGHEVDSNFLESYDPERDEQIVKDDEQEALESSINLKRLKALMTKDRWNMVELKVIRGMTTKQVAAAIGVSETTAEKRLDDIVNTLAAGVVAKSQENKDHILGDGSEWLSRRQICARMNIKKSYLQLMLSDVPRRECKFKIDRRDYSPISGGRIRYKESKDGGIVFPRIIERTRPKLLSQEGDIIGEEQDDIAG